MRRFVTASDIEILHLTGQRTLYIDEEDVVTSIAREMAEKLGVTIALRPTRIPQPPSPLEESSLMAGPKGLASPSQPEVGARPWVPADFLAAAENQKTATSHPAEIILRNGTVVWPGQSLIPADIHISQGKILSIHRPGDSVRGGRMDIDLEGKYVLPGIIDPHVHLGIFIPFDVDVRRETKAGLWGGVTTVGCYLYEKGSYLPKLEQLWKQVRAHSLADIFFHVTIATPQHLEEIPRYVHDYGIRSLKIYMSGVPGVIPDIDDGFMTRVYEKVMETGERCTVCIHAENASLVRWATEEALARDEMKTTVQEWSETHPAIAEEEAIRRAALLTKGFEGVSTYFVHVSTKAGIQAISEIKCETTTVLAETTSPYLLFSIEGKKGNLPKWLPPLRDRESIEALWDAMRKGKIDTLGTDSVPMGEEMKGPNKSVWEAIPNAPSMEHHLPGVLTEGVANRNFPLPLLIDRMTRRPAEVFGIFPRKGSLLPGSDADLVVVDMDRWQKVRKEQIKSATPFSLYEDQMLTGWPILVMKGGTLVMRDGRWIADPPPSQVLNEKTKRR